MKTNPALSALRHHVTGAIERGEAQAIAEVTASPRPAHTPGPWHAEKFCIWAGDCYVAGTSVGQGDPEQRANALLIAAAPDLLNLLTAACRLEELTGENLAVYARTFAALARSAIARATGNQ